MKQTGVGHATRKMGNTLGQEAKQSTNIQDNRLKKKNRKEKNKSIEEQM